MRFFTLHRPSFVVYFSVLLLGTLLLPKPSWSDLAKSSSESSSTFSPDPSSTAAEGLPEPQVEIRAPVETPPTEYLPYPPPPNYSWPAGQNAQNENPKPSESDPPAGWNTGQSGSSGNSGSSSTSRASSPLRPHIIFRLLASVLPVRARRDRISHVSSQTPLAERARSVRSDDSENPPGAIPAIDPSISFDPAHTQSRLTRPFLSRLPGLLRPEVNPRSPVETPPTEYLPYPPPPNYNWPAGTSPNTENPSPSECDPPAGWYGGTGETAPDCAGGGGGSKPGSAGEDNGALPPGYDASGQEKVAWWIILIAVLGGLVFLALVTWAVWRAAKRWKMKKQQQGGGGAAPPQVSEMTDSDA